MTDTAGPEVHQSPSAAPEDDTQWLASELAIMQVSVVAATTKSAHVAYLGMAGLVLGIFNGLIAASIYRNRIFTPSVSIGDAQPAPMTYVMWVGFGLVAAGCVITGLWPPKPGSLQALMRLRIVFLAISAAMIVLGGKWYIL